jgi:NAD(P)-dependent dehydrogenase (short-subunit alcohol dehydrogenase family)
MNVASAQTLFRAGLLKGMVIALAGGGEFVAEAELACGDLGAAVEHYEGDAHDGDAMSAWVAAVLDRHPAIDAFVFDGSGIGESEHRIPAADAAWVALRGVANGALIPHDHAAKAVLIAPRPGGREQVAARAALENMARELSIEWARYGITPVTVAPGAATSSKEVAALTAYLVSPAGAYFSGCLLELGAA